MLTSRGEVVLSEATREGFRRTDGMISDLQVNAEGRRAIRCHPFRNIARGARCKTDPIFSNNFHEILSNYYFACRLFDLTAVD